MFSWFVIGSGVSLILRTICEHLLSGHFCQLVLTSHYDPVALGSVLGLSSSWEDLWQSCLLVCYMYSICVIGTLAAFCKMGNSGSIHYEKF